MKMKKVLALVLCIAMVLSTMSFTAFAEAAAEVSSNDELIKALAESRDVKIVDGFTVDTAIKVPDGVEIDLNGNTLNWSVENSYFGESTVKGGSIVLGKDDVHVCDGYFLVNEGKKLTVNGVTISSSDDGMKCYAVFHLKEGAALSVDNSTINVAGNEYASGYVVYANESTAKFDLANSIMTSENVAGVVHATTTIKDSTVTIEGTDGTEMEHGINRSALTITNSTVTISGGTGRGITAQHGDLVIDGNSKVSVLEMREATIKLLDDKSMTVADNAEVKVDVDVNNTGVGTVTGTVDRLP
ncbi:MAG: hypothetical protein IJ365_06555, partial [Clostridia bacterium]|nr:hypothetical protein [Clostridia bacterium]